mmetsp:Transcript_926/g.2919  ORF Transcript_926/g.2919 Transcript_926/m.2919 type:complete len:152 (-) Transcript_926:162-617(-)
MPSSVWEILLDAGVDAAAARRGQSILRPRIVTGSALEVHERNERIADEVSRSIASTLGEQLTVGGLLGFATGFSLKRIGKMLLFVVGTEVCFLQYFSYRGWVDVRWNKISEDLSPALRRQRIVGVLEALASKMPFATSFSAGMYAGLKYSG